MFGTITLRMSVASWHKIIKALQTGTEAERLELGEHLKKTFGSDNPIQADVKEIVT